MSPSPFAVTSPTDPASYAWEATDEGVAERFGIPIDAGRPLRPQHVARSRRSCSRGSSPTGRFETRCPSTRRATTGASSRPRPQRYGVATDEVVPGAGADEILDMCTKAFLPAGEAAVISVPTYAMYRVVAEQRGARVIAGSAPGPGPGLGDGRPCRPRGGPRGATLVWVCSPNNPTGASGARRRDRGAARRHRRRRGGRRRPAPASSSTRRTASSPASHVIPLRLALSEPGRRPDRVQGVRAGRAARRLRGRRVRDPSPDRPVPAARLHRRRSPRRWSREALRDAGGDAGERGAGAARAAPPRRGAGAQGWRSAAVRHQLHPARPRHGGAVRGGGPRLMGRGLVPRTFGHGHPLAHCLRDHRPRPRRERPPDRGRREITPSCHRRPAHGPRRPRMTTPLGALDVDGRNRATSGSRAAHARPTSASSSPSTGPDEPTSRPGSASTTISWAPSPTTACSI